MERRKGIVRWYSAKGFGFIDPLPNRGVDEAHYFHLTAVVGRKFLKSGQLVTFEPTTSPKGLCAVAVYAVETNEGNNDEQQDQIVNKE